MSFSMANSSGGMKAFARSTPQLYRDCLRLVLHIAGRSRKGDAVRKVVRMEFKKNAGVKDAAHIEQLKSSAIRGLANYLMIESTAKDAKLMKSMNEFSSKEAKDIKGDS